ncbi:MAG: arginine--tRNA ligase [Patescibacteria group bacterium]
MEEKIQKAVQGALADMGAGDVAFAIGRPNGVSFGDYATNAALVAAKQLGKNPRELAEQLADTLRSSTTLGPTSIAAIEVAGPGFVNITLAREAVALAVAEAEVQGSEWGKGTASSGVRTIVEYGNPNAFKEMHIGHLVGTVVGESVARLIENAGATLARDTFGGDIGPNVAKALWGLQKAGVTEPSATDLGTAYAAGSNAYDTDETAKVEIDALNQAIYAGSDAALMDLWRRGREVSMEEFRRIWKLLGTHFDFEFFDSDTTETGLRVVKDGLEKGVFEMSDGAVIYNGEKKGVHTMVFITSHNTPTYEAKDIGLAFLKEERWPSDKVIIVTGNEQTGRFRTVLSALAELAPNLAAKMEHLATGFLKLTSGKMSSREGNVVTAADFITSVVEKTSEKNADPLVAEQVAVGAIKYMILRQAPGSDIIFDEAKSLSLEGDSGPYLQYALVRAKSVVAKTDETNSSKGMIYHTSSTKHSDEAYVLERITLHFPEVAARAASSRAPNLLVNYLTELAGEWNAFYAKERIIGGEHEAHKLLVARAFINTMTNGLTLLGIPTPERM